MRRAGERLAVDCGHFGGVVTLDGHENDAAGRGPVQVRVNDHVLHRGGCRLERSVAEVGVGAIETAKGSETREGVGMRAVRGPEVGGENARGAEDAEIIAASFWPPNGPYSYSLAGFRAFRGFDG